MLKTMRPRYTAPKISPIRYLFGYFSILFYFYYSGTNGFTERPCYTGFHGLSVRGITALQCINGNLAE